MKNEWKTEQETENEKEKSSKREKDKEKEINKTIKTDKNVYPSISPQGETGREDFSLKEKDLDKWLVNSDQQPAVSKNAIRDMRKQTV